MGQWSVTEIRGAVATEHVAKTVLTTVLPLHKSLPVPVIVAVTEQAFNGTVQVAMKSAEAPGANVAMVKTVVLGTGRSLMIKMLLRGMSPVFLTVPL